MDLPNRLSLHRITQTISQFQSFIGYSNDLRSLINSELGFRPLISSSNWGQDSRRMGSPLAAALGASHCWVDLGDFGEQDHNSVEWLSVS